MDSKKGALSLQISFVCVRYVPVGLQSHTDLHLAGPKRLWAAQLALGIEVFREAESPTTRKIFLQPCEAQRAAEARPSVQAEFRKETSACSAESLWPGAAQCGIETQSPTNRKNFRQPCEAQRAAEGPLVFATSAEQLRVGASGCPSPTREPFKGLREDSQRTLGKPFFSHVGGGGSEFSADLAFRAE